MVGWSTGKVMRSATLQRIGNGEMYFVLSLRYNTVMRLVNQRWSGPER
jgi:hypothetical protein